MLGAEMITLKDNDQVAPIMPVFTWTENFLIDVVSQHPNKGVHKEQSGYLEFRANLGSLDPKGKFKEKRMQFVIIIQAPDIAHFE